MSALRTNINVPYIIGDNNGSRTMDFLCEYRTNDTPNPATIYNITSSKEGKTWYDYRGYTNILYNKNDTIKWSINNSVVSAGLENSSKYIRVYFPLNGMYDAKTEFMVNIYTYIGDNKMTLFCNAIKSTNNLACAPVKYNGYIYQEYQDIRIVDALNYVGDNIDVNYLINVTIIPVTKQDGNYYAIENTNEGSSFVTFKEDMNISIVNELTSDRKIKTSIALNNKYDSLTNYFKVYGDVYFCVRYFLISRIKEELYINKIVDVNNNIATISFDDFLEDCLSKVTEPWDLWDEGLQIAVEFEVYKENDDHEMYDVDDQVMSISSQGISLTKEKFGMMLPINSQITITSKDNLITELDNMSTNINVINEITRQNIVVNQVGENSGIITPVFFKTFNTSDIILHRDMQENICINLDDYKNKVSMFYIKLCGNYFTEYARTYDGVIFKINSEVITSNTGSYYICDENKELITTGKYVCE